MQRTWTGNQGLLRKLVDLKSDELDLEQQEHVVEEHPPTGFKVLLPSLHDESDSQEDIEEFIYVQVLRRSPLKELGFVLLSILTGGILWLIARWFPQLFAWFTTDPLDVSARRMQRRPDSSVEKVGFGRFQQLVGTEHWDLVLVRDKYERYQVIPLTKRMLSSVMDESIQFDEGQVIFFEFQSIRFIYQTTIENFSCFEGTEVDSIDFSTGLSHSQSFFQGLLSGANQTLVREPTYLEILFDELLHPFFIFQLISIVFWMATNYYYYSVCVLLISGFSIVSAMRDSKQHFLKLQRLCHMDSQVACLRDGIWNIFSAEALVPGDIVSLNKLHEVPADGILLRGSPIVDESMLTGESVAISKMPMLSDDFDITFQTLEAKAKSINRLYAGTKLFGTEHVDESFEMMLVTHTGFHTAKGKLLRSIMYPPPITFKIYVDAFRFLVVLGILAILGFVYTIFIFAYFKAPFHSVFVHSFDLITTIVPPALPATMMIGINIARKRLSDRGIFCIRPQRINVCGKIDMACFDKTGTLTEDSLSIQGVLAISNGNLLAMKISATEIENDHDMLARVLAGCHSLRMMKQKIHGDPLEKQMLGFSEWRFDEGQPAIAMIPPHYSKSSPIELLRIFEFSSSLKRMSVIIASEGRHFLVTKGAPEILTELCAECPDDFMKVVEHHSKNGKRVIACAFREIDPANLPSNLHLLPRVDVEKDLQLCGVVVFENKIKKETYGALEVLRGATIPCIMATGDNLFTAMSVARQSGMIDAETKMYFPARDSILGDEGSLFHLFDVGDVKEEKSLDEIDGNFCFALTQSTLEHFQSTLSATGYEKVLLHTAVFARMTPDGKKELVLELRGYEERSILFCGDGANDVGALRAADVGVSLSEAEASVAAPFTSSIPNISCVPQIISEGRASLVTSFSCFKYMAIYSLTEFTTVALLYSHIGNLGEYEYLYVDLIVVLPLSISMAYSRAIETLSVESPVNNLFSLSVLFSMIGHIVLQFFFQLAVFLTIKSQSFYEQVVVDVDIENVESYENTVSFLFSIFVYILLSWILSVGPPFRQHVFMNQVFLVVFVLLLAMSTYLLMSSGGVVRGFLLLENLPMWFRWVMLIIVGVYGVSALGLEKIASFLKRFN